MEEFILGAMKYFTDEEWSNLDGSEHLRYGQILYIYYACINLEIKVETPHFMLREKSNILNMEKGISIYRCEYCNVTYLLEEDRNIHSAVCKKRSDFSCDQCTYTTDKLPKLKQHKLIHTTPNDLICNFCDKSFSQKSVLKRHIKNVHSNEKKDFKCERCTYETNRKCDLTRHMIIHADSKVFVCEYCNKTFNRKDNLNMHYLVHNKEKQFQCALCEKSYLRKKELTKHMNAIHLNIKPFKCNDCSYSTADKSVLKRHTYTHLKTKPLKCNLCNYQCSQNGSLAVHVKNCH